MGQYFFLGIAAIGTAVFVALFGIDEDQEQHGRIAVAESARSVALLSASSVEPVENAGDALAAAAFGMSALQPRTYNGELVVDIIQASPLPPNEKRDLVSSLAAAEAGRVDLDKVLAEVRVALALE